MVFGTICVEESMGLMKTRRLAAMHPPPQRLRRTGKQQRAKAGTRSICLCIVFLEKKDSKVQLTFDKEDQL